MKATPTSLLFAIRLTTRAINNPPTVSIRFFDKQVKGQLMPPAGAPWPTGGAPPPGISITTPTAGRERAADGYRLLPAFAEVPCANLGSAYWAGEPG